MKDFSRTLRILLIFSFLAACDNMVDPTLETSNSQEIIQSTAAKNSDLRGIFAEAAAEGVDVAVTVLSSSGEPVEEFKGAPADVQAFLDNRSNQKTDVSAGKAMGGELPWIQYVIRWPSSLTFTATTSTTFDIGFPDRAKTQARMSYDIESVFWDDDIPMSDPDVNFNNTPGSSTIWTSSTEYPGPSGWSGHHRLSASWITETGYQPCESEYSTDSDYGLKADGAYNMEYSPDYTITLVVGDCLEGIIHASGYPTGYDAFTPIYGGSFTDEANIDHWKATNQFGYTAYNIQAQYTTTDQPGRHYDLSLSDASCSVPTGQVGFPAISGPQVTFRPDMTSISSGNVAVCEVTVNDTVGGASRVFQYWVYQP